MTQEIIALKNPNRTASGFYWTKTSLIGLLTRTLQKKKKSFQCSNNHQRKTIDRKVFGFYEF